MDVGNTEYWEEVKDEGVLKDDWFGSDIAFECIGVLVVTVFDDTTFGITVHKLIAATEDEEGDGIKYVDSKLSFMPVTLVVLSAKLTIEPTGVRVPSESTLVTLNSELRGFANIGKMCLNNDKD